LQNFCIFGVHAVTGLYLHKVYTLLIFCGTRVIGSLKWQTWFVLHFFWLLLWTELWEDLLRLRISLQKAMVLVNQLPQPDTWQSFMSEANGPCRQTSVTGRCHISLSCASLLKKYKH